MSKLCEFIHCSRRGKLTFAVTIVTQKINYHNIELMSRVSQWFSDITTEEIVSFASVEYLTPVYLHKIFRSFDNFKSVLKASEKQLLDHGVPPDLSKQILKRPKDVTKQLKLMKQFDINVIKLCDSEYPALLKHIDDPPLWLFYRGSLESLKQKCLTVVGTRKPSTYALAAMEHLFVSDLMSNVTTLSGLAYGVDKKAHELSLKSGGTTVAVLAGGLDCIYPSAHIHLAEKIIETGGALISEYPPLSTPEPYRFPIRNRIIAGLSPLTVIVEAKIKSGTMTTAKSAVDYNRDIMSLPGDINRPAAEGPNMLIKKGAMLLDSPDDLLQYYNIKSSKVAQQVDKQGSELLNLLTDDPKTVDQLVSVTGEGIDIVLSKLTELELVGLVYQISAGCYSANKK